MERIQFSDATNKLRRNLLLVAALIIALAGFDIKLTKASTSGIEFENITTNVVLAVLLALLIYHLVAFAIHAFEEYRHWELALVKKQTTYFGGGIGFIELADQMRDAGDALEKIIKNSGAISAGNQQILDVNDASHLKELSGAARVYAKRLQNFPSITRFRFWFLDIGFVGLTTIAAVLFVLALPRGLFAVWIQ